MGFAWQRCWKLKRINLISDIKLQKSILFRGSEVWPRCPNVLSSENFPTCVVTYTWEVTENVRRRTFLRWDFTQITIFSLYMPIKSYSKVFLHKHFGNNLPTILKVGLALQNSVFDSWNGKIFVFHVVPLLFTCVVLYF